VGVFARVADVLLGADAAPLEALGARPRLLMPVDAWALVSPEVAEAHRAALTRLQEVLGEAQPCTLALQDFPTMAEHFRILQGREAWTTDGSFIRRHAPVLGPGVVDRFMWASTLTDAQVAESQAFRERFRKHLATLLGTDGVLVLPTMPDVAPLLSTSADALQDYRTAAMRLLCSAGLAGAAQVSLPMSHRLGAPLGLSLLGPAGSDRSLVTLAERIFTA
jgi:amidase